MLVRDDWQQTPLYPICRNAPINIIIYDDLDGGEPHVTGQHCPTCGSPDALEFHVHYEDEVPANPSNGWRKDGWDE